MTGALVVLGGYLLGSMPFGYWVVRLFKGEDIRTVGSGNIGATNVWRTYGKGYGIPIVLLDVAKGFVPALVGTLLVGELAGVLAGGAAMLGHWRPLFLRFQKGGKTVATGGRDVLRRRAAARADRARDLDRRLPRLALRLGRVDGRPASRCRSSALALGEPWPVIVFAAIAAVAVLVLHKANIARLRAGTESRFHFRRGPKPASP